MIELRTALKAYLKTIHPRVYFQVAPEKAAFPYFVYDIIIYPNGDGSERITLDVDGWDSNDTGDTTAVENLMTLLKPLDKQTITTQDIMVTFYLDSKTPLMDDDKRIKRRKYIYEGKLYNIKE